MSYERPYYEDINYRPLLYYVIFGVSDEELNVSRERHKVDAFPDGLNFTMCKKAENSEYMSALLGGELGKILAERNHSLYETAYKANQWAVIQGEIEQDQDLNYMRNVIGFVQALVETGAVAVLDLLTFTLFTPEEWTENIFALDFDPYAHVVILESVMEDGSVWLHTRGLGKFGRPDISLENVDNNEIEQAVRVVNQLLYYSVLGAFFSRPTKVHTHTGQAYIVNAKFHDDFDNPDFNNAFYQISWKECELAE